MRTTFDDWFARKMARTTCAIREPRTVEEKFHRFLSARDDFAQILLRGEPSDTFEFRSKAEWPMQPELYNASVLDGILDELLATGLGNVVTNIRFVLTEIGWHDVYSSPNAFYQAARAATRKITDGNVV
jgi:hypothetical protein